MNRRQLLYGALAPVLFAKDDQPGKIALGKAADFYCGPEWDKPFLYPIRTVSGRVVSRGYPLEKIAGEQTDHAWHRGLFYGHALINGEDFWREEGHQKTSRLIATKVSRSRAGDGVSVELAMRTPKGNTLGTMRQHWRVKDREQLRFIDVAIEIDANQGQALTFGDTDDGGFAFRLSDAFRQDRGARLRNSEGLETTEKMWGKAARWIDYSTVIDGVATGVAIFDHPGNLRHPTRWHARGYSLCAANPFASKAFSKGKDPDGSYTLASGKQLRMRYRVVVYEGSCDLETLYREWK